MLRLKTAFDLDYKFEDNLELEKKYILIAIGTQRVFKCPPEPIVRYGRASLRFLYTRHRKVDSSLLDSVPDTSLRESLQRAKRKERKARVP